MELSPCRPLNGTGKPFASFAFSAFALKKGTLYPPDHGHDLALIKAVEPDGTRSAGGGAQAAALAEHGVDLSDALVVEARRPIGADGHTHPASAAQQGVDGGNDAACGDGLLAQYGHGP